MAFVDEYFSTLESLGYSSPETQWELTNMMLVGCKKHFCMIHETPEKEKTREQIEALKIIRNVCGDLGKLRYNLVMQHGDKL